MIMLLLVQMEKETGTTLGTVVAKKNNFSNVTTVLLVSWYRETQYRENGKAVTNNLIDFFDQNNGLN